jgi:hypothetical protein
MARPPYEIEFYEDEDGDVPVLRWLKEDLTPQKRRALGAAMNEILQHEGPNVANTNFGKALGRGLFEFRLDQDIKQILARKTKRPKKKDTEGDTGRILLRVFFHVHGDKIILLLGGYDKAERSSHSYQQSQIELSRRRLASWRSREGS